jgi:hypothetical protein
VGILGILGALTVGMSGMEGARKLGIDTEGIDTEGIEGIDIFGMVGARHLEGELTLLASSVVGESRGISLAGLGA